MAVAGLLPNELLAVTLVLALTEGSARHVVIRHYLRVKSSLGGSAKPSVND